MIQAALLGGLFIGVLSALPIVNIANCCCLWIMGGGVLSVYLAHPDRRPISPGQGAILGLLAGVAGALVWVIAYAALDVVVGPIERRMLSGVLERSVEMPPDVREMMETIGRQASSPVRYILGFLFQLVAGMVFATLGGLLGAILFRRGAQEPPP